LSCPKIRSAADSTGAASSTTAAAPASTGSGLDAALRVTTNSTLGAIKRPDGSVQLTLDGWPLYRYAGDSAPGQINGEGIDGSWFAVRPTGAQALTASTGSSTAASTGTGSTGGYGY
jgi:hypothetical protein